MILTVLGARPQFVKAAALSKALAQAGIPERIIHTGQHYDKNMSDVFFEQLGIPGISRNLNIGSGNHGAQTGKMLEEIEHEILSLPDLSAVLVYGDTNSTVAGALAASKLHIPVIHVEAGLRSYNKKMPEEINRVLTDHVSHLLFCSSEVGVKNLSFEGISENVYNVGDIMLDSVNSFLPFAKPPQDEQIQCIVNGGFHLMTIHRPANTNDQDKLQRIINGIARTDASVLWPVHPRNQASLASLDIPDNLRTCEPMPYFEMLYCLNACNKVFTDSGGLQKEAYWLKTPCITIRPETEWVETLHSNWNQLCDPTEQAIFECSNNHPDSNSWKPLYGDGSASTKIVNKIQSSL